MNAKIAIIFALVALSSVEAKTFRSWGSSKGEFRQDLLEQSNLQAPLVEIRQPEMVQAALPMTQQTQWVQSAPLVQQTFAAKGGEFRTVQQENFVAAPIQQASTLVEVRQPEIVQSSVLTHSAPIFQASYPTKSYEMPLSYPVKGGEFRSVQVHEPRYIQSTKGGFEARQELLQAPVKGASYVQSEIIRQPEIVQSAAPLMQQRLIQSAPLVQSSKSLY